MEALVFHKVFQKVEKESVVVASKSAASVLGYEINTQKLPLELRLSGETVHQAQSCYVCARHNLPIVRPFALNSIHISVAVLTFLS